MAKTIQKKMIAFILTLAMVISHIPAMTLTGYGQDYAGSLPVAGFGNALDFSANFKQRIDVPYNDSTKLAGNSNFTISMWIYPEANSPYQTLYRQYNTNSGSLGVWLRYINDNGGYLYFGFDIFDSGGGWQWPWDWSKGPPPDIIKIPVEQWVHVAMTKTGKNVIVYVNGTKYYEMVLDDNHYNAPAPTSATISIGGEPQNNQFFDGRIDEIRFWNIALSQAEIEAWMFREIDSTHTKYGNLVFHYKFNQTNGTVVMDSKGSNNANMVNMSNSNWFFSDIKSWTVNAGMSINGKLVGSDSDGTSIVGTDWDLLTFEIVAGPGKGTVAIPGDNIFTYTANMDGEGSDTFS